MIDQSSVPNTVTELPGVTRKATVAQIVEFVAESGENADVIDGKTAAAVGLINTDLGDETTARQNADAALQTQIDLGQGRGGALPAHDFGTAAQTQAALIEYARRDIWGDGGTFALDAEKSRFMGYCLRATLINLRPIIVTICICSFHCANTALK